MANERVEIQEPISNSNGHTGTSDSVPETSSGSNSMEDTEEYRILMAYATRRRSGKKAGADTQPSLVTSNGGSNANGTAPSQTLSQTGTEETPEKNKDKKRRKKGWRHFSSFFKCVKPQTDDTERTDDLSQSAGTGDNVRASCFLPGQGEDKEEEEDELDEVADRLTKIADEIKLSPPELETDNDDDVERIVGLLLREHGDKLNERLKQANIGPELLLNYSFFERLMNTLLISTGYRSSNPSGLGPQASQKTQVAVTCEITSRLSAVETLPMSSLLQHGARYLQAYYSSWAQQQGGYEVAIDSDDEEVD